MRSWILCAGVVVALAFGAVAAPAQSRADDFCVAPQVLDDAGVCVEIPGGVVIGPDTEVGDAVEVGAVPDVPELPVDPWIPDY